MTKELLTQNFSLIPDKVSIDMKHVEKGWGWERWIVNCEEYCGKLLFFEKDKKCSWHYHKIKDEVFYVQSGKIYRGLRHQMLALKDSELFEFSTQHFDSDSHRIIKGD